MRPSPGIVGITAVIVGCLWARAAAAYPQWQFSSGSPRCNQCHFAPDGGGLLNGFGRDAAGEEISTFGGNGAFLHGAVTLPSWVSLGGDFRGALVTEDVQDPSGPVVAVFPMQAELDARLVFGDLSLYGSLGSRGQVRANGDLIPDQNYQPVSDSQFISPEHYVMWRPSAVGPYVRAGRFFAPFGLRLADHYLYVRRDLGFNLMEETYNVSGGYVDDEWELHFTLFAPDFVRHLGSLESGVALYLERRLFDESGSIAVQARYADGPGMTRTIVGLVGKYWAPRLRTIFMAEGDLVHREIPTVGGSDQFVGLAGFSVLPAKGLMLTGYLERNQVDLTVADSAWNALDGLVGWFPYAHVELQILGRLQFPTGTATTKTFLAQIHYFL